jgi:WD40 repeat protein
MTDWNPEANDIFLQALDLAPEERAAYLDRACPGNAGLRAQVEALLAASARAGSFLGAPAAQQFVTEGEPPGGDDGEALDFLEPSDKPGQLGRLGHYEILEVVGRGGMGVVLKAFDDVLRRVVAIKVLAPHLASSGHARKRFIREARAAAGVTHEHVVTIHAVEETGSLPYIVMQYVHGLSLQERIDRDGPLELKEVLRIGLQTASGLAAAHALGLVHRDIKPANILLENGVERVKITDFGLARAADDASLTQSGVVAGTPQYMAPEQAAGEAVDQRADLFSLGSVLYAMCTGRPPFRGSSTLAVLRRVCEEQPHPVRELNPDIPEWLCRIIARLHAKDPAERFGSAREVADLLGRHLAELHQPGREPVPGPPPRPRRPRRVGPVAVTVLLVLAAALVLVVASCVTRFLSAWLSGDRPDGTLVVEVEDGRLQVQVDGDAQVFQGAGLHEVRLRPGVHEVRAILHGKPVQEEVVTISPGGQAAVTVRRWPDEPGKPPEVPTHPRATLLVHPGPACTNYVGFAPDGRTLVVASEDGTIERWDPATGQEQSRWKGPTLKVMGMAVSPDGRTAATAAGWWDKPDRGGDAQVWELATGKLLAAYHEPASAVMAVAFAPDGKTLAVGAFNGAVRLVEAATAKERATLQHPGAGAVNALAFTADGKTLVGAGAKPGGGKTPGLIRLWDVDTGKEKDTWRGTMAEVQHLCISPDGRTVAVACRDSTIRLWDAAAGHERAVLRGHTGWAHYLAFLPGGKTLVSGSFDGTVKVWETASGRELATLTTVMEIVLSVAVSPDGRTVAAGGGGWHQPGRVEQWDSSRWAEAPQPRAVLRGHGSWVWSLAFSPDGHTLATGSNDQHIRFWDTRTGKCEADFHAHAGLVTSLVFTPDGKSLGSASNDGKAKLWDAATHKLLVTYAGHTAPVERLAVAPRPSGCPKTLATASMDGNVKLWDLGTGKEIATRETWPSYAVVFAPDGKTLAASGRKWQGSQAEDIVRVLTADLTQEIAVLRGHRGRIRSMAYAPDGKVLATGSEDGTIKLWDAATGKELKTLTGHRSKVFTVAFSPDGKLLASGGGGWAYPAPPNQPSEVKLWDVTTGKALVTLSEPGNMVFAVAFSADGATLATANYDTTAKLWAVASLIPQEAR